MSKIKCKVNIRKIALLLCNFILLMSGLCLILLGCVLMNDAPRILLSNLAVEPGTIPQPLLYYVALASVIAGMVVSSVALLGCWTSLGPDSNCTMALYILFLVVLLLIEISLGVVASLCPQVLGAGMDHDQMVASLMNNYGVPGRDQYTAAVDLAQTIFECCGMQSGSDFDGSRWWKREQDSNHDLRVPKSCCFLENGNSETAFLDPLPVNLTLCQAKNNARYQHGRHVKGCIDQLNSWFKEHIIIFLIIGLALVVVQLSVLLCAIMVCLKKKNSLSSVNQDEQSTRSIPEISNRKIHCENYFEPKRERKNANCGTVQENGFSTISSRQNHSMKALNSNKSNYSQKNLNYLNGGEWSEGKRNDSLLSPEHFYERDHFLTFRENRNSQPQTGPKFHTVQGQRHRMLCMPHPEKMNGNENHGNVLGSCIRKSNDFAAGNYVKSESEVGT